MPLGLFEQFVVTFFPVLHLAFGLILGDAVAILDHADELIAFAGDHLELIIGELALLLLHFALGLFPVALYTIPVHIGLLG